MKTTQYCAKEFLLPFRTSLARKDGVSINVILRPVSDESDLKKVKELLVYDFGILPDLYNFAQAYADIIVAEKERKIVGMALLIQLKKSGDYPAIISVPWISVSIHHRKMGLGTAFIRYIKRVAQLCGIARIDAAKSVTQRSGFLLREGFRMNKRSPAYHDGYFLTWLGDANPSVSRIKYVPLSVLRGDVIIRYATANDKSMWKVLVLQACDFNIDHDVMHSTFTADLRLVAERVCDGKLLGMIAANQGWIIMLGCEPNSRNCGLGSLLMFCAMDWSSRRADEARHSVSLAPLTLKAQRFYEKWGFKDEKTTKKDGFTTLRCEFDVSHILPQDVTFDEIVRQSEDFRPSCKKVRLE